MKQQGTPNHVAIIPDGNNRWAKARLGGISGHKRGSERVLEAVDYALEIGVPFLSFYLFSTENWQRPKREVQQLLDLLEVFCKDKAHELHTRQVKIKLVGVLDDFPLALQKALQTLEQDTRHYNKITLIMLLSYSGQQEIVGAAQKIAVQVLKQTLSVEGITAEVFAQALQTKDLPVVDLLIRTSGEQRISNCYLWQLAYAELYFTPVMWPDFDKKLFAQALEWYSLRQRRFGKTSNFLETEN